MALREVTSLSALANAPTQAVIINCGTKWVSSLALLSTLRNTDCPVLVIDCESGDGSRAHFRELCSRTNASIDWLEWRLCPHPATLDRLFREIAAKTVLLVDSDVEVLSQRVYAAMSERLAADRGAYGAGFVHGPSWMGAEQGLHQKAGYYMARMWIPFTLLRTAAVRAALDANVSFEGRRAFRDLPGWPRIAKLLGYRYRLPFLRRLRLPGSHPDAQAGNPGEVASFWDFDTGAVLHQSLLDRGYRFVAVPDERWSDVRHFHGVTRAAVASRVARVAGRLGLAFTDTERSERSLLHVVKSRLAAEYGIASEFLSRTDSASTTLSGSRAA